MDQLLIIPVLVATASVLSFGALLLIGLIALAGFERSEDTGWAQRVLCRLSFDRLGSCGAADRAG